MMEEAPGMAMRADPPLDGIAFSFLKYLTETVGEKRRILS
jgi:hypothetical protein